MSSRLFAPLAWACCLISVALGAVATYLIFTLPAAVPPADRAQGGDFVYFILLLEFAALGAFLASRQESNRIGWMASGIGLGIGLAGFGRYYSLHAHYGHLPAATLGQLASNLGWDLGIGVLATYFPLLYPNGRLLSPRWRPVAAMAAVGIAMVLVADTVNTLFPSFAPAGTLLNLGGVVMVAVAVAAVVSLVRRYRSGDPVQRLQLKWFVAAAAACGVTLLIQTIVLNNLLHIDSPPFNVLVAVVLLALPVTVAIAVLKYRLYDIDVVINRALVYGVLAAFITAVYVAIVVGVGGLIGSGNRPNLLLSILATAVVAVAFQPVRARVQAVANRLVYGYRATPYEALTQFSHRVAGVYADDEVLPRLARVLAEGTGAASTAVWIRRGADNHPAASWPPDKAPLPAERAQRVVEVRHEGETLGTLTLEKRAGEPFTPVEDKLLNHLAAQAGQLLRNVRLTSELQSRLEQISVQAAELRASRQRIVAAQDTERQRLEKNIHDGAQQHLVALAVKLRLASTLAKRDPAKARRSLEELKAQTTDALQTLRDLAQGIYPPALREGGLVEALKPHARVTAENVGRYDPEIEAGIYFCCLEAIQNATKYARASQVRVDIEQRDGQLTFAVVDDGVGFDTARASTGRGLQNMKDRIASLGGVLSLHSTVGQGTRVAGWLPVTTAAAVTS